MSRIRIALAGIVAAGLMTLTVSVGPALADSSTTTKFVNTQIADGWWLESPTEITTDVSESTSVESDETFSSPTSQIRQPINPDGTSTWPAKRGVIPVQFNLTMSPTTETTTTTTTTTTVTRRPSFKSIGSDGDQGEYAADDNDWSLLTHRMPAGTTVKDIESLVANYSWLNGGTNHGGSLRWVIEAANGPIWVHFGPSPNFDSNDPGSGVNTMAVGDDRFDLSGRGGAHYNTLASILGSPIADEAAPYVRLAIDGGWGGNQELNLLSVDMDTDLDANDHVAIQDSYTGGLEPANPWDAWTPGDPFVESDENVESVVGAPVSTNEIPAFIQVEKQPTDSTPLDVIEVLSSAQGDSTGQFRQIDGKYMYNLKAETLGKGSFKVYMVIDGVRVNNLPGVFELR
jgi:hypothetical protein